MRNFSLPIVKNKDEPPDQFLRIGAATVQQGFATIDDTALLAEYLNAESILVSLRHFAISECTGALRINYASVGWPKS